MSLHWSHWRILITFCHILISFQFLLMFPTKPMWFTGQSGCECPPPLSSPLSETCWSSTRRWIYALQFERSFSPAGQLFNQGHRVEPVVPGFREPEREREKINTNKILQGHETEGQNNYSHCGFHKALDEKISEITQTEWNYDIKLGSAQCRHPGANMQPYLHPFQHVKELRRLKKKERQWWAQ